METTKNNPNDIPKRDIDPSMDEDVPLDDTPKEMRNKNRFRVPKNHLIPNVISNVNEQVVTRRQSILNEMGLIFYTFQLEPKNVEESLGNASLTTALHEKLNQFTRNDAWYLVPRPKDKYVIGTKWIFKNK